MHRELLAQAREGSHRFLRLIDEAVSGQGWEVSYHRDSAEERLKSAKRNGKTLFHMDDPYHDNALTYRLVYYMPFWQIEKSAKRWEWDVAQAQFDPSEIDKAEARQFHRFWSQRLFGEAVADVTKEGFVYVPLQGRLLDHRSFQAMSPAEMVLTTVEQEPDLPIVLTFHPKETYTADEMTTLDEEICAAYPRVVIGEQDWLTYLAECDYLVTQNSSAALAAMFFRKPSVLFGQIDFHHICGNVYDVGVEEAFRQVKAGGQKFKAYLKWFLQDNTINAGKDDVHQQILDRMRRHDWDI